MVSRNKRRWVVILGILVVLAVFAFLEFFPAPTCQVWVKNQSDGALTDVTLTFPNDVTRIGDIEAGRTVILSVPWAELHRIRYQCKRADGSSVDEIIGIQDDGELSRYEIITTPTNFGTNYEWRWMSLIRFRVEKLIRWGRW